jgi:hypothetical protein
MYSSLQRSMGVYNEMQVQLWADPHLVRKSHLEDAIARWWALCICHCNIQWVSTSRYTALKVEYTFWSIYDLMWMFRDLWNYASHPSRWNYAAGTTPSTTTPFGTTPAVNASLKMLRSNGVSNAAVNESLKMLRSNGVSNAAVNASLKMRYLSGECYSRLPCVP